MKDKSIAFAITEEKCTGCSACMNICPTDAIIMAENGEGFIMPKVDESLCVNCGKCVNGCPVLHPVYDNEENPACFAMMASDKERMASSTGGFMALLAEHVLELGGVAYGAVWAENWSVKMDRVDQKGDLQKLRGSKYIQANVNDAYKKADADINAGRLVLFTGTPCQIAGLKAFLSGKNYDKLITAEIICHGAPSYAVLKKYLYENFDVANIKSLSFRDKAAFGWDTGVKIIYKDDTAFAEKGRDSAWWAAYNPCLIMRKSCSTCPFSRLPRQADFSAGDFWGVNEYDAAMNDGKGTAFILVNNARHADLLASLSTKFKLWKKVPIDAPGRINKTIFHPFKANAGRKHFFSSAAIKPFNKLVKDALAHHYDIGVVGLWYGVNYGSILTYYALYKVLRDYGLDPVMLPKPPNLWDKSYDDMGTIAQRFIWENCNVFLPFQKIEDYVTVNKLCDDFILGSDVVWNYHICGRESGHFFFLDFVEPGRKKYSYASSFGNKLSGPEEHVAKALELLGAFTALSCREYDGAEYLRAACGKDDAAHVLDPVFLCPEKHFLDLAKKSPRRMEREFLFAYLLNITSSAEKNIIMRLISEIYGLDIVKCFNPNKSEQELIRITYNIQDPREISVYDWLKLMSHCSYFFGDSYHGLCFSLIFHKNFIIVYHEDINFSSLERFRSLLSIVGLENRLMHNKRNIEDYIAIIKEEINWHIVDERLDKYREKSRTWLLNNIIK